MNLGNKIRTLRKERNLTQEQLAIPLNISAQAVSKWEMGISHPDIEMLPVVARLFRISLDELFDFDTSNIDKEVEQIILKHKNYFWSNFEKAERILLDGLQMYPNSIQLKTELFQLYTYHIDRGDEILTKALELGSQIICLSQDIFCTCRTKANLIRIYEYQDMHSDQDHYEDIKKIIESIPYMYPYMLQDRMRLSANYIKGAEGMQEAKDLKILQWQEFFCACWVEGNRYYEIGDFENARKSYQQSVDVIERFMYEGKEGDDAYPIHGTYANHAITILQIASCLFRLNETDKIDVLLERAKQIYFDAYEKVELRDYYGELQKMIEYYTLEYRRWNLDEYKPLDLRDIDERIKTRKSANADS